MIDQSGQLFAEVVDSSDLDWLFAQGDRSALDVLDDAEDAAPDVVISRCRPKCDREVSNRTETQPDK